MKVEIKLHTKINKPQYYEQSKESILNFDLEKESQELEALTEAIRLITITLEQTLKP